MSQDLMKYSDNAITKEALIQENFDLKRRLEIAEERIRIDSDNHARQVKFLEDLVIRSSQGTDSSEDLWREIVELRKAVEVKEQKLQLQDANIAEAIDMIDRIKAQVEEAELIATKAQEEETEADQRPVDKLSEEEEEDRQWMSDIQFRGYPAQHSQAPSNVRAAKMKNRVSTKKVQPHQKFTYRVSKINQQVMRQNKKDLKARVVHEGGDILKLVECFKRMHIAE